MTWLLIGRCCWGDFAKGDVIVKCKVMPEESWACEWNSGMTLWLTVGITIEPLFCTLSIESQVERNGYPITLLLKYKFSLYFDPCNNYPSNTEVVIATEVFTVTIVLVVVIIFMLVVM